MTTSSFAISRHRTVDAMKSRKGFTLVETIVVAVIVGILAIVAGTLYYGYVNDTQQATVNNLAQTGAAAANSYFRKTGQAPDSAQLNLFLPEPGRYRVTVSTNPRNVTITDTKYSKTGTATY